MTFCHPFPRAARLVLAAWCFWIASAGVAGAQTPILLAEKSWAVGYILVGLFIFLGLLSVCIPRLRRIEMVDEEPGKQPAQKGAAQAPASPYGSQYGQFGQQPAYGQQQRPQAAARAGGGGKSRMVAGLLGIFLGGWGIHRFYLGYPGIGAAMIGVTLITCGSGGLWGVIDGIMILSGGGVDCDGEGRPLGP